jgi:hypothetical protein
MLNDPGEIMRHIANVKSEIQQPLQADPEQSVRDGWEMAEREGELALESIELKHNAEVREAEVEARHIEAAGHVTLHRRDSAQATLQKRGFDVAQYLHEMARGHVDLIQAIGLFAVSAALALCVLLAFGPGMLSILLALVIAGSTLSVEEFFQAHEERGPMREGIFLVISVLALAAQYWFGVARGKLMAAMVDAGPVSHMLSQAGPIIQSALGILAIVIEILCGWKLYRARAALLFPTARAFREREQLNARLLQLGRALEATKTAPEIRRHYRVIGMRQQLAWAAGAEQRAHATHLKRALKGAVIALVILVVLFLLATHLSAAPPPGQSKLVLMDLSKSVSAESFQANVDGVAELIARFKTGDHLVVFPITDRFGAPILLNETMPNEPGYMRLQERSAREAISAKWMNVSKTLKPTFGRTDVLGALIAISYLGNVSVADSSIYVFSDLQQSTREADLEHLEYIPVTRTIAQLKRTKTIPRLDRAAIYCLGVDPVGKSAKYYATLREFWFAFFRESGAELKVFSIDHHVPEL